MLGVYFQDIECEEGNNKISNSSTALQLKTKSAEKKLATLMGERLRYIELNLGKHVEYMLDDMTSLHGASLMGYKDVAEVILKFGLEDIDSKDWKQEKTAIYFAALKGHSHVIDSLLEYGCDINVTIHGKTPLDYAMDGMNQYRYAIRPNVGPRFLYSDEESDDDIYNCDYNRQIHLRYGRLRFTQYSDSVELLEKHILKMKVANLHVSDENLLSLRWSDKLKHFQNECEEEITKMKSKKMNKAEISYYDILTKDKIQVAMYMKNESIVKASKPKYYRKKFPIYASMIKSQFRKGVVRNELLYFGIEMFHSVFSNFPELPYECIEHVFSFLTDYELMAFNGCWKYSIY